LKLLMNPEFLRRLALAAGLFVSIMMYTNTVSQIYLVHKPDFKKMHEKDHKHKLALSRFVEKTIAERPNTISKQLLEELKQQQKQKKPIPKLSLDEFIAKRTKGSIKKITGPKWQPVIAKMKEYEQGRTPEEWRENTPDHSGRSKELYFSSGTQPFSSVAPRVNKEMFLTYNDSGSTEYIRLSTLYADRAGKAKESLLHPWRAYFWAPFVLGLLLYGFVIPKVKRPANALGYSRLWGVMISDFFGLLYGGLFFLLGSLAMSEHNANLGTLFSMETGPMILVFCMWLLALVCLGGMWFGISYRNFWINLLPHGLERHNHSGVRLYPYQDMKRASLSIKKVGWIVQLILLLGGTTPALPQWR
jgi:hypothetical protein